LIAGEIDVAIVPQQDLNSVQHTLEAPGIRLMSVAQAEAIAKTVPGLKHVVLWRGLLDLSRDVPNSDVDLLGSSPRLAVFVAGSHARSPLASRPFQSPR
jgi:hypothetical protein